MSINSNNNLLNEILSTIDDLPTSKEEQEKSITIIENGTTEVTPDEGKALSKVTVNVEIEQSADGEEFVGIKWLEVDGDGYPIKAITSGVKKLDFLFYNTVATGNYRRLKEISFPTTFTEIGYNAFLYCTKLESVSDISNVTIIRESAFDRCSNLVLDELPHNLIDVGRFAFRDCSKVRFTTIPATTKYIAAAAFNAGWKNSNTLTFKGTPLSVDGQAFMNNLNITDIYCPWAEGAVENAPWGATNATIHYNTTFDENGNPIAVEV